MSINSVPTRTDSTQDSVMVDETGPPLTGNGARSVGQSLVGSAGPQMVEVVVRGSFCSLASKNLSDSSLPYSDHNTKTPTNSEKTARKTYPPT